jgi:AraC-like DNA-binding protein
MAGRPPFKPTSALRRRVELLRADGWPLDRIAAQLEIAQNTLKTHFAAELELGADRARMENLEHAAKAAKRGNATMIRWLQERFDRARARLQLDDRAGIAAEPPKPEKLGKKQERLRAAREIRGKYAPPPPPAKLH